MLRLLLWQKARVRWNELVRGGWRRRIGFLAGLAFGVLFVGFVFASSLTLFSWLGLYDPDLVRRLVAGAFTLLSTFALFWGMGNALSDLYLSSDLELLLAAPVPLADIFRLKLLGQMWNTGVAALLPVATLVAYGLAAGAGWTYYLGTALVWVLILATLVSASMALVMLLMRFMPADRAREIYSFLYVILFAGLWLGWMLLSRGGSGFERVTALSPRLLEAGARLDLPPASWAGYLMVGWAQGAWGQVIRYGSYLTLLATGVIGLAYVLFERSFHHDWAAMREVATRKRAAAGNGQTAARPLAQRLAGWLPWPARDLAAKDWTILPRDLRQLSRLVMPLVVSLFYVYQFGFAAEIPDSLPSAGFLMALFILPIVPLLFALALGTTAIGKEGSAFEMLRVMPIPASGLLWAKVWTSAVPTAALGLLVTLAVGWLLRITPGQAILLASLAILVSFLLSTIAVALGALTPNFQASDYRRSVGPLASYGTMVLGGLVWLVILLTLLCVALQLPPGSFGSEGLRSQLIPDPAIAVWFRSVWLLLIALLLDIAAGAGLVVLWRMATRRIDRWQPTE